MPTLDHLRTLIVTPPFKMQGAMPLFGVNWDPKHRVHIWRGPPANFPAQLLPFRPLALSWGDHVERELNNDGPPQIAPSHPMEDRAYQTAAVNDIQLTYAADYPGYLLGDEVGLGKTVTAWRALQKISTPGSQILIVAPLSVLGHWREVIFALGTEDRDVILLNYDRLRVLYDVENAPRNKDGSKRKILKGRTLKGVARYGEVEAPDFVVWDECHRLKNLETARAKFAFKLYQPGSFHIWLSATPGQVPLELGCLLPLLRRKTHGTSNTTCTIEMLESWAKDVGVGITRGKYGAYCWQSDKKDCDLVADILFVQKDRDGVTGAIRRLPESIAGWPTLQRQLYPCELTEGEREMYQKDWETFQAELNAMPIAKRNFRSTDGAAALTRFLQKASLLRVPHTTELAKDLHASGKKVAISCRWLQTVAALQKAFADAGISTTTITGATRTEAERQAAIQSFHTGQADIIIFTVVEGINLQEEAYVTPDKPRAQIDHDLRWSGIEAHQIDGRCHRNGKFALVYWCYGQDTKEEAVAERVIQRLRQIKYLTNDDPELIDALEKDFCAV